MLLKPQCPPELELEEELEELEEVEELEELDELEELESQWQWCFLWQFLGREGYPAPFLMLPFPATANTELKSTSKQIIKMLVLID